MKTVFLLGQKSILITSKTGKKCHYTLLQGFLLWFIALLINANKNINTKRLIKNISINDSNRKEDSGSLASMILLASDWSCTDSRSLFLLRALGYSSKRTKDIRHIKEEIPVSFNEPFDRYGFDSDVIL